MMFEGRRRSSQGWVFLAAFVFYSAVALVMFHPLVAKISTDVPADLRDPFLNTWILWWNAHHVPLTREWWNAPAFYPVSGVLAFSEHLFGLTLLTTPIQWLGGSPLLAYNLAFLVSFPLSALAAHGLCYSVTRRHDAALLAGLSFAFNPYRVAQLPHLQVLSSFWMPVSLWGLHAFLRTARLRFIVLCAVAWLMQGLSNGYYLLFLPVLLGAWLLWFMPPWINWRRLALVMAVWVSVALFLLPLASGYYGIHDQLGLRRSFSEIAAAGAHLSSVFNMSHLLAVWRTPFPSKEPEKQLFPGITIVLVIAVGILQIVRRHQSSPGLRESRTLAIAAGVARRAYQRRSSLAFYVLAAGLMWLLSLGPAPTLRGTTFWVKAPYSWLMVLPGFWSLRVPARFAGLMMLCLSMAAGLAFARLVPALHKRRLGLVAAIGVGILADTWIRPLPTFAAPRPLNLLEAIPPSAAVLELPLGDEVADSEAVFRSIYHHLPVVNGYSGYFPPHYGPLATGLEEHDDEMLTAVATLGPIAIVVNERADADRGWTRYLTQHAGVRRIQSSGTESLYWLPKAMPTPRPAIGIPLRIVQMTSNGVEYVPTGGVSESGVPVWRSREGGAGGEEIVADLGSIQTVRATELWLQPGDAFPRELLIAVSTDGQQWDTVWQGHGSVQAFEAALENPLEMRMFWDLGVRSARFVRIRQVASVRKPWSIADLRVLPPVQ